MTKFPSTLILMELTEELASKNSQLELSCLRRDHNQLADNLTNERFDMLDSSFRVPLKGEELEWQILDKLLRHSDSFYKEVKARKVSATAKLLLAKGRASCSHGSRNVFDRGEEAGGGRRSSRATTGTSAIRKQKEWERSFILETASSV